MAHDVRNLPLYLSRTTTRSHDRDDEHHHAASAGYAEDVDGADTTDDSDGPAPRSSSSHRLSFPQSVRSFATVSATTHHGSQSSPSPPPPLPSGPSHSTFASSASDAASANDDAHAHHNAHGYTRTNAGASPPPLLTGAAKARAIGATARATVLKLVETPKLRPDLTRSGSSSTIRAAAEQNHQPDRSVGESASSSSVSPRQGGSNEHHSSSSAMADSHSTSAAPPYSNVDQDLISALSLAPTSADGGLQTLQPVPPRSLSGSLRHCADQAEPSYPIQQSRSCPPSSASSPLQSHEAVFASPSPSPPLASLSPPTPQRSERFRHASSPQTSHATSSSSISSTSSFLASSTNTFQLIGAKLQSTKFKDRFHAVGEQAKEWGGKGKGKIADAWVRKAANGINHVVTPSSANSRSNPPLVVDNRPDSAQSAGSLLEPTTGKYRSNSASGTDFRAPSPSHSLEGNSDVSLFSGIKLPCLILGVRVPRRSGMAFGIKLDRAVQLSSVTLSDVHRKRDNDPITGDEAKSWLPAVAYRCLQYLEEWGKKEEGIYRIPGRSNMINQLRALFDAGMDKDLREIHPGDLDPHAVASLFKLWLRELPESLISSQLEAAIDMLTQEAIGYSASSSNFLYQQQAPPSTGGLVDGRAPKPYLEKLRELFGNGMPAEHFYLLRALSYHLARLASHSSANKMTLSNLRLILSPTFRLSPVFVQVLVEDREIIFGRMNEDARLRDQGFISPTIQSPILGPAHTGYRSADSPTPPPLPQSTSPQMDSLESSQPHALTVTSPSSTPSSSPFFATEATYTAPTPPTLPFRTPIAERFAQYRSPPLTPGTEDASSWPSPKALSCDLPSSAPNGFSSGPAFNSSKPAFLPSRNVVNGGGFFGGSRDKGHGDSLSSGGASMRKNSADSGRSNGSSTLPRSETTDRKAQEFQLNLPQGFGLGLSVPPASPGKDDEDPWGLMRSVDKT
ncbi:BQ2448_6286 [Microbotryum intermedium]|uniref:BQ2448_6286 protein n=1 Tax=Microbotryum intermedium TaxID=269621 RepID=A0A238FRX4_9BASI|nr:BQ2448_6286 [Microbotryum intermedium]